MDSSRGMECLEKFLNVYNRVGSPTNLREKMESLKRKCDTLYCIEDDVIRELKHAESSSRKKRRKEVENWLYNVGRIRNEVQSKEAEVSTNRLFGRGQLMGNIEDLIKEVTELMDQRHRFPEGLTLADPEATKEAFQTKKLVGQEFKKKLESIWESVEKNKVLIIGVWGMGGVGKTSLVEHIYNRMLEHPNAFDDVCWITVSENPTIYKLQYDIAKVMRVNISFEDDERKRAALLSKEFRRRYRSILILDNVWNDICLARVGIPLLVNGCKLIIITRSSDVCQSLGCELKTKILPLCDEEEEWELFITNLKHHTTLSSETVDVAKLIVRECAGLPFGILTVARCMSGKECISDWRDALQALRCPSFGLFKMEEKVFKMLELSYSCLNNERDVQRSFLYCMLFPENHKIEREVLIQCLVDEGLIERMGSRREKFDRGHVILNRLVNSCLLEDVVCNGDKKGVKMHDLVRDMAIKMMSSQFMVKAGMELDEIPDELEWSDDVERVSLMDNKIEEIASGPRCHKLLTLFLSRNRSLKKIETSFFKHMTALQFLDLSSCNEIEELPTSISNLKRLTSLVLRGCTNLQRVPSLAKLKLLKRLDLGFSGIKEAPEGMERLVKLTYLDLDAESLQVFRTGILPRLSQLEYLTFCGKLDIIRINGQELSGLKKLSTFQGWLTFDDNVNGLQAFGISRRQYLGYKSSYRSDNVDGKWHGDNLNKVVIEKWSISNIAAAEEDGNVCVQTLEALLNDVQSLEIVDCKDARSLCDLSCLGSPSTSSSSSFSSSLLFQTIENLQLKKMLDLRALFEFELEGEGGFRGEVVPPILPSPLPLFSCLKSFSIKECPLMKKLFQPGFLPNLRNLEVIRVSKCHGLQEIISAAEQQQEASSSIHASTVQYTLPKLRTLSLNDLPGLKRICAGEISCGALSQITVQSCTELQRIPFSQPLSSLQSIKFGGRNKKEWWESVECVQPSDKNYLNRFIQYI